MIGHYLLDSSLTVLCLAAIAALVGQMWPIFLRFFGGRGFISGGIVTAFIVSSYLPWMTLVTLIPLLSGIVLRSLRSGNNSPSRSVPLSMLLTFALLPFLAWLWGQPKVISVTFIAIFLLLIIRRLTADISLDLKGKFPSHEVAVVLINRLLYDRIYRHRYH